MEQARHIAGAVAVVVAPGQQLNVGPQAAALAGEAVRVSYAGRGQDPGAVERLHTAKPAAQQPAESGDRELGDRDESARCGAPGALCHGQRRDPVGALAGHHHEVRPAQRSPTLPPRARWQGPGDRAARLRAHHRDVEVPTHVEALVGVVEHDDLGSLGHGPPGSGNPVRILDDDGARHQQPMHVALVPAVAAQHDGRFQALAGVVSSYPGRERGLSGPPHGEVPDGHRRHRRDGLWQQPRPVGARPGGDGSAIGPRRGEQCEPGNAGREGAPGPEPVRHEAHRAASSSTRRSSFSSRSRPRSRS